MFRGVEIEECSYPFSVPSCDGRERAHKVDEAFRAATLNCTALDTLSDVRNLNGIDIYSYHGVMNGKREGSTASRGNTEDASSRLERTKLDFSILVRTIPAVLFGWGAK